MALVMLVTPGERVRERRGGGERARERKGGGGVRARESERERDKRPCQILKRRWSGSPCPERTKL